MVVTLVDDIVLDYRVALVVVVARQRLVEAVSSVVAVVESGVDSKSSARKSKPLTEEETAACGNVVVLSGVIVESFVGGSDIVLLCAESGEFLEIAVSEVD